MATITIHYIAGPKSGTSETVTPDSYSLGIATNSFWYKLGEVTYYVPHSSVAYVELVN